MKPENSKRLTQQYLVPLGTTLIYIAGNDIQILTTKLWWPLFQQLFCAHQTLIRTSQTKMFREMLTNKCILNVLLLWLIKQTQKKINRKKLGLLTWTQSINWWLQVNPPNRHPRHNLPKIYGGSKTIYKFWIRPTENFKSHQRTSFRINERWCSK